MYERRKLSELKPWSKNPRSITDTDFERLKKQIKKLGVYKPLLVNHEGTVLGGNMRYQALKSLGITEVMVSVVDAPDEATQLEYALSDNDRAGNYDDQALAELLTLTPIELDLFKVDLGKLTTLKQLLAGQYDQPRVLLEEQFGAPPFTVLDTRQGYWQDRRRGWLELGIKSEAGRDEALLGFSSLAASFGNRGGAEVNTSIFDPVLCELMYRWFCPAKGSILDPFAGGSVRGIVANHLGYNYTGIELREEQVLANRLQALDILAEDNQPTWIVGDSSELTKLAPGEYDFIFSCPPYFDLEVYSNLPGELSAIQEYSLFKRQYSSIIAKAINHLKPNRFACFVVGEVRDKEGFYHNFVGDTIQAFIAAGTKLYNEAILVNQAGSLPLRVKRQFQGYRKLGKNHQNVLIFYKGDPKAIKADFSSIDLNFPLEETKTLDI